MGTNEKFRKGELVMLVSGDRYKPNVIDGYRPVTHAEISEWKTYALSSPMDDAGESRLPPRYTIDALPAGTLALVIIARVAPILGYTRFPKMTEIFVPSMNNTYFVKRSCLSKCPEQQAVSK